LPVSAGGSGGVVGTVTSGTVTSGTASSGTAPRVLLVGYNGANNTGSEALLLADIADVRAVLGPDAHITVPTLNEANLRRYVREGPDLTIAPVPSIYFRALRRLVKRSDLVILVEGSAYMDTWTSALLWAFLWATKCAKDHGKPCLAYAVDSGELRPFNRRLVRREASKTDLIVVRSHGGAERLRSWGVTAPMHVTADNALTYAMDPSDQGVLRRLWPEAGPTVAGMAVVDYHIWPVVIRPWGRREDCYKWPYYFSRSRQRRRMSEALAADLASVADHLVEAHSMDVALLCMEQLDEPLASAVHERMAHRDRARVFSSRQHSTSRMTAVLRDLDVLVTSRYHAAILSMAAGVPQLAIGHDLRLRGLYQEMGLEEGMFIEHCAPDMCSNVKARLDMLLSHPAEQRDLMRRAHDSLLARARRNRELLRGFITDHGWGAGS
jgi:polysaccharide pyruvyl transferase WcaK-like protein